jgi:hypothetical protein
MKPFACKIKEKFFHPVPVFGQLVALVRQAKNIERVIRKTRADKYSKKFKSQKEKRKAFSHLVNFVQLHITSYIDLDFYW